MLLTEVKALLAAAFAGWWADRCLSLGAAIAFYTVFSLAPVLFVVVAVAGLFIGREAAQSAIVAEIGGLISDRAATAVESLLANAANFGSGIAGTAFGIVTFFLLATGAIVELQDSLNIIWKAKPPEHWGIGAFIRSRLLSLALLLGLGFLLLVSLVVDAAVAAIATHVPHALPRLVLNNVVISLAGAVVLFALIFKLLPDVRIAWSDVWIGAAVTGVLFTGGKLLIGAYLGRSGLAAGFGAAAAIVTVLLWVYYASQILLFGAEFTKAYAERYGSRRHCTPR